MQMILYILLGLLIGAWVGYGVAYTRYWNAKMVDELRNNFQAVQDEFEQQELQMREYAEQNRILKHKSQILLDQNEDFSKMVSELSRYYHRIKQGGEKLKEAVTILDVSDGEMEAKLTHLIQQEVRDPEVPMRTAALEKRVW